MEFFKNKRLIAVWAGVFVGLYGLVQFHFFKNEQDFFVFVVLLLMFVILECYLRLKKMLKKIEVDSAQTLRRSVIGQLNLWTEIRASFEKLQDKDSIK